MPLPPFDYQPKRYTDLSSEAIQDLRRQFVNPAIFHYYRKPLMIVEGSKQYVFDETGRRYLDGFGGIVTVSVGHCHPKVTEAGIRQMQTLQHTTTIYLHPNIVRYAQQLTATLPEPLRVCYFVNSGSEANDLAVLMARVYTGNHDMIALRNAYHGGNHATMALTAHHTWKYNVPQHFGVHHAIAPDLYRGRWQTSDSGPQYAEEIQHLIDHATSGKVAGFIAESIQGVGGVVVYPEGYLSEVYRSIRKAGGLCIADEVQSGFGRSGSHYWGFETQGVIPDIVTMAKGIGNGFPLGAVVTTPEVAAALAQRIHFNTFGGNPVACAMGSAVLEVIAEEKLQENCAAVGSHLLGALRALQSRFVLLGDVRGRGLMIGCELVKNRESKEPASEACRDILEFCREHGLLLGKGGLHGNVLRIKPPMCIGRDDADFIIEVLAAALTACEARGI